MRFAYADPVTVAQAQLPELVATARNLAARISNPEPMARVKQYQDAINAYEAAANIAEAIVRLLTGSNRTSETASFDLQARALRSEQAALVARRNELDPTGMVAAGYPNYAKPGADTVSYTDTAQPREATKSIWLGVVAAVAALAALNRRSK